MDLCQPVISPLHRGRNDNWYHPPRRSPPRSARGSSNISGKRYHPPRPWRLEEGEKFRWISKKKSYGGGKKTERCSGGGSRKKRSFGGGISKKRSYGGGKKTERSSGGDLSRGEEPVGGDAPLVLANGVVATENMNCHIAIFVHLFFFRCRHNKRGSGAGSVCPARPAMTQTAKAQPA
ncbi:hypothetical protein F2Q69_00056324 [Brassica cretica]|uniref:Uncharacterized protein n=1 Tax=Brassica cretica TaxID=69181 RepID=A0A8S9N0D9_BRACR|nr:hypothetical protein F2Q69_00056324 [Brassica cretica]